MYIYFPFPFVYHFFKVSTKRRTAPTHQTSKSMTGRIDRRSVRSNVSNLSVSDDHIIEDDSNLQGSKEEDSMKREVGTRTVYVIVQENLFHGNSGQLSSVFDLKGVTRYGAENIKQSSASNGGIDDLKSPMRTISSGASHTSSSSSVVGSGASNNISSGPGHRSKWSTSSPTPDVETAAMPGTIDEVSLSNVAGDRAAQLGPSNPQVLLDGDFLKCTAGLPVPLFERDKALMNVAIFNDTMFLQMLNVIDYSLLVGVYDPQDVTLSKNGGLSTEIVNTMTAGIIDYLHPYNVAKRMEGYFKNAQHELKLRAAESTIQKASEYKKRFRASADLYFMALPSSNADLD